MDLNPLSPSVEGEALQSVPVGDLTCDHGPHLATATAYLLVAFASP
jgi:hypothetical protein